MVLERRKFIQLSAATLISLVPKPLWAQSYPSGPITLVVFLPAGAIPDIIGRLIGELLSLRLGKPIIIENRPGAGGNLALQAVARAPADGHTLLLLASPHAINVSLYPNNPVSLPKNITPVASLNRDTFALLVNPSLPVNTVAELVALTKANPGKINLSSNGTGNLPISRASCSNRQPASTPCMCPIADRPLRWRPSWLVTCRRCSIRSGRPYH